MLICVLETSKQPLNSRADWGEQWVTRSLEHLIHETAAAQRSLCLPHTAPSINKPSARGDETIWTWTSEENILLLSSSPLRGYTQAGVFLCHRHQVCATWLALIDSSAAQWCRTKRWISPWVKGQHLSLAHAYAACKQGRQRDQSSRPFLLA